MSDVLTLSEDTIDQAVREYLARRGITVPEMEDGGIILFMDEGGRELDFNVQLSVPVDLRPPSVLKPGASPDDLMRKIREAQPCVSSRPVMVPTWDGKGDC